MHEAIAQKIFSAIASSATQQGSFATKTKLLKLLYLFDVEYYRTNRRTFTGYSWKFLHLGPWAREYDPTLDAILAASVLKEHIYNHETGILRATEDIELTQIFPSARDASIFRNVMKQWAGEPTNQILNKVYFGTEPMVIANRNEPLDFSVIPVDPMPAYQRTPSGVDLREIARLRSQFQVARVDVGASRPRKRVTPPDYDEAFEQAMLTLDSDQSY